MKRSAVTMTPWSKFVQCLQEQQLPSAPLDTPLPPAGMRKGNSVSPCQDVKVFKVPGAS